MTKSVPYENGRRISKGHDFGNDKILRYVLNRYRIPNSPFAQNLNSVFKEEKQCQIRILRKKVTPKIMLKAPKNRFPDS